MGLFERNFQLGALAESRPYLPSHVAHALDQHELVKTPEPVSNPGRLVSNGLIAGASNGGAVSLAGEEWGFDFVAAEGDRRLLRLLPAEKGAVEVEEQTENLGMLKEEGMAILTHEGMIVIAGIVTANVWVAERARYEDARVSRIAEGLWSILPMIPLRAEISDVASSGITSANWLSS